jgi:hypothetical protein
LRKALVAGVALAFLASLISDADAATRRSNRDLVNKAGKAQKAPPKEPFPGMQNGPLQIVVSIGGQHATLYANGVRVEQTKVSTGTASNPTPLGVFSVIEKDRWHRSNLYNAAPMYFMHRLTWSGVAMHEGMLPGYAASHGCIRMPTGFVSRLWQVSKLGVRVVIARNDPVPYEFGHEKLFNPKQKPAVVSELPPIEGLRRTIAANEITTGEGPRPVVLAQATTVTDDAAKIPQVSDQAPKTVIETVPATAAPVETTPPAPVQSAESIEAPPPPPAPTEVEIIVTTPAPAAAPAPAEVETTATTPAPAAAPPAPAAAADAVQDSEPDKRDPTGAEPRKPLPPRNRAAEPTKKAGQVAVFVSKKEKKIFVRVGFVPVFDMPIEIANPDQPLGTHVFTAMEVLDGGTRMRWNAITMPPEQPVVRRDEVKGGNNKRNGRKAEPAPTAASTKAPSTATEALDRVNIPQAAIDRISELLIPGSSLVISDHGLGNETGRYTEFVVLTR